MTLTLSLVLGTVFNPPVLEFAQLIVPYLANLPAFCHSPSEEQRLQILRQRDGYLLDILSRCTDHQFVIAPCAPFLAAEVVIVLGSLPVEPFDAPIHLFFGEVTFFCPPFYTMPHIVVFEVKQTNM